MNTRGAIDETLRLHAAGTWAPNTSVLSHVRKEHLQHLDEMYRKINPTFSEAKLNRWLGYMQATLVICTSATLDEMKQINKDFAG